MIEVEMKIELALQSQEQLQKLFETQPSVHFINQTDQVDSYYDTDQYTCFQQAVFIRMRNRAALEMKYHETADPFHTQCTERVFPLVAEPHLVDEMNKLGARFIPGWHEAVNVEEALALNCLAEFVRIEKQRKQYVYEDVFLCIDTIPELGQFLEVEIFCNDDQEIAEAENRLQEVLLHFAVSPLRAVHVGYVELWLRRHRPQIYRLGRYQYEEVC